MNVVIAGVSTRAAADSAARAGFAVTAIDAFADRDQHPSVEALSLGKHFTPEAAVSAAQAITCDAVVYGSNFENHPDAIARLAAGRSLWGNSPDVVRRVRDPQLLTDALRRQGCATPDVRRRTSNFTGRWLVKPLSSGGGHRIRMWATDAPVPRGYYLQEFVEGPPGSVVFIAAGGRAVPIGLTRQLIGDEAFGASGFRYCGNILTAAGEDDELLDAAVALANAVAGEFLLVGANGVDFVARRSQSYAVEVNPRWCASMELVERAYGLNVFHAHAGACADGVLPDFDLARARAGGGAIGKAIVFATRDVTVGDTDAWLRDGDVRDVPHSGARIGAGQPVCTMFASARDANSCRAELVRRAERVYAGISV